MTKEEFLNIKSYEEFDKKRNDCANLDFSDLEIRNHFNSIFPKAESSGFENGVIYEVHKDR